MKTLCLVLVVAVSLTGCSSFTKTGRIDRAYNKQLKQASKAREKRRKDLMSQQRSEMKKMQETPAPPPMQVFQSTSSASQ